jgi:hypothetical protein
MKDALEKIKEQALNVLWHAKADCLFCPFRKW